MLILFSIHFIIVLQINMNLTNLPLGAKKANTKSRLLNENVSQAIIDEKFQITTIMEVNSEGIPIKDKMVKNRIIDQIQSKLTVSKDKGK